MKKPKKIFTLHISLDESDPEIWRRIMVPDTMSLAQLHYAIQVAMGWQNCHLHEFIARGKRYTMPYDDFAHGYGEETLSEHDFSVGDILSRKGQKIAYVYDFGDSWEHTLRVKATGAPEKGVSYPRCIDGANACPPEDSGALWGYYEKLVILKDPKHPDYEMIAEWMGEDFDPEAFDLARVNAEFAEFEKTIRFYAGEEA